MEGLIFGGAYVRREICVSKSIGLACGENEIYHFCFVFVFCIRGQIPSTSPPGAYIRRGTITEGFLRYDFGDLYLEGLTHGGTYFRNFTVSAYLPGQYKKSCRLCFFSLPVKKHQKLMPWNDLRTQPKMVLTCDDRFCPSKHKSGK